MAYFICGVDPTTGGIKRTAGLPGSNRAADDFAVATLRVENVDSPADFVHMFRGTGMTSPQMSAMIHKLNGMFNYEFIIMDPGGGGLFIRDELRQPKQDDGDRKFEVEPITSKDDDQMRGLGQDKLILFSRADSSIKESSGLILSTESFLVNKAHELLKGAFESQPPRIRVPPTWPGWSSTGQTFNNANQMREFLFNMTGLSGKDKVAAEIDLALFQLAFLELELDKTYNPTTDKYGMYQYTSSMKKDSAYALLYAYFGVWFWRQINAAKEEENAGEFPVLADDIL